MKEHDTVALARDEPQQGLKAGDIGAIVHIYKDAQAYEVEFVSLRGKTLAILTLPADAVRPIAEREIASARAVA